MINVIKKTKDENIIFKSSIFRKDRKSNILHNSQQQRSQSANQQQQKQSTRFQSKKRAKSKFQQYTSSAPQSQSQQFAFRQSTVSIPSAPIYVAAFGLTYIFAANFVFLAAIPAFAPSGYAKKIANLTKLYTEKMKYEKKTIILNINLSFFIIFAARQICLMK